MGWDKKITIFLDDPSEDESEPLRVIDAAGTALHPGYVLTESVMRANRFKTQRRYSNHCILSAQRDCDGWNRRKDYHLVV